MKGSGIGIKNNHHSNKNKELKIIISNNYTQKQTYNNSSTFFIYFYLYCSVCLLSFCNNKLMKIQENRNKYFPNSTQHQILDKKKNE